MTRKMLQFTHLHQRMPDKRPATRRRGDFAEISEAFAAPVAGEQSSRCEQCGIPFCSLPQLLHDEFLRGKEVLVVAGTHGKTTTTSMLAWIFHSAGLQPSFLIGGIADNFMPLADGELAGNHR